MAETVFVCLFAAVGVLMLRASYAGTISQSVTVEPETAGIVGNAAILTDSGASSGKSITFGDNTFGPQPASMPAGAVKPEQFGAAGNGALDDTSAVQQALNAGVGKTVWLSAKTYLIDSKSLLINSNTTLSGAGPTAVLKFTWFDSSQAQAPIGKGNYLRNKNAATGGDSNITLSNFVIEGGGNGLPSGTNADNSEGLAASITLGNVTNFTVTHLEVRNSPGISISYHESKNGNLTYNYVHNSGRDGITGYWAALGGDANTTVANNYISKAGDDLVALHGLPENTYNNVGLPSNIRVINNTLEGWYSDPNGKVAGRAIALDGVRNVTVQNNSMINTGANSPGILLVGCWARFCKTGSHDPATGQPWLSADVRILNNTIYNAGQLPGVGPKGNGSGILIDTTRNSTITGNRIVNSKYGPVRNDRCDSCNVQAE